MRKPNDISSYSFLLTLQAHFRFFCWCLCFKSVAVFCSCLIKAFSISPWKAVPEGYSSTFENILWKLMGKETLTGWVCIYVVCVLLFHISAIWPFSQLSFQYCCLEPTPTQWVKTTFIFLMLVQIGWGSAGQVDLARFGSRLWVVPGQLHVSLIL